ncbi:hypothetical protein HX863_08440 [Pseudomonas gingeri]|nr:hypothetical protein [Pseudomonas gingeri]
MGITLPDFFAEGFILGIHSFDSVCVIGDPFVMARDIAGVGLMGAGVIGDPFVMVRDATGVGLMGGGVVGDPVVMARDATGVGLMGGGVVGDPFVMVRDVAGVGLMGGGVVSDPFVMACDAVGAGLDSSRIGRDIAQIGFDNTDVRGDRLGRRRPLRERWLRSGGNRSFPPRTALCGRSEVPGIRVDRPAEYWRWLADL